MKKSSVDSLVALFEALADPIRLRILNLMSVGEICVCFFVEVLGEPQPKISRHLAYLRKSGIVEDRRDGKWMHYRISESLPDETKELFGTLANTFASDALFQRDRVALERACCSPRASETLKKAPRPPGLAGA